MEKANVFLTGNLNAVKTGEVAQVREGIGQKTVMESHDGKPDEINQHSADDPERWLSLGHTTILQLYLNPWKVNAVPRREREGRKHEGNNVYLKMIIFLL